MLASAVCLALGCANPQPPSTGPEPTYALTGRVLLVATRRDVDGIPQGDLEIDDADGVRIRLLREGTVVDSALSVHGSFVFQVPLGTYRAAATIGGFSGATEEIHVHDRARSFEDPIQLSPAGLEARPNPFSGSVHVRFSIPVDGPATVVVRGIDGALVNELIDGNLPAGVHEVRWDAQNALNQPVAPGPYWIVLQSGAFQSAALLVRTAVTISGLVEITSRLADETNKTMGTRVVRNLDGVRVHLEGPEGVDSTATSGGFFHFPVAGSGTYRIQTRMVPDGPWFTREVTVGLRDTMIAPLAVGPVGLMDNYPNPFSHPHGVGFEFTQAQPDPIEAEVRTLSGQRVWWTSYEGVVGLNHVHWTGVDMKQNPVPDGPYVMVLQAGGLLRHNVVYKETPARPFARRTRP